MFNLRGFCIALLLTYLIGLPQLQGQDAASDSVRFNQPIPVTIRMANNVVVQTMLVGIDQNGISTVSPQGRAVEYAFNKIRTVRSKDGSLFFTPAKDDLGELLARLNALNPSGANSNPAGSGIPTGPGSTVPFTVSGAQPGFGHGQPMPSPPGFNSGASPAQIMAHAQAHSQPTYNPPPQNNFPSAAHSSTPFNNYSPPPSGMPNMPMGGHSQMPPSSPMSMPGMNAHNQMNNNMGRPSMGPTMGQQMVWQYECTKCHFKFTSPTEVKAGHRCTKCGIVWGEIHDENGRTISSSPAAKIGGGVGIIALVISIIVAIVRKVQSS